MGPGQSTQTDPIGLAGGLNLYGYAGGDPVNSHDPFGLSDCPNDGPSTQVQVGNNCFDGAAAIGMVLFSAVNTGRAAQRAFRQAGAALRHARGLRAARQSEFASGAPTATDEALQGAIEQLFRAGDNVPGGTAGAVRYEVATGTAVGGKFHTVKAAERMAQLNRMIGKGNLNDEDRRTAQRLVDDLNSALNSGRPR